MGRLNQLKDKGTEGPEVLADLSETVQCEDVLHGQDAAEVFLNGCFTVGRLVILSAGCQPGQHLPVLWTMDVL